MGELIGSMNPENPWLDLQRTWQTQSQSILLLLPNTSTDPLPLEGGILIDEVKMPWRKNIEHAGRAYRDLQLLRWDEANGVVAGARSNSLRKKVSISVNASGDGNDDDILDENDTPTSAKRAEMSVWELKRLSSRNKEDYYELLGLEDKRWRATEDDIKRAFRMESMKYHPDKVGQLGEEAVQHAEEHFKHMKKAYELLSDKRKRAGYDSIDDFDESIPAEKDVTAENFYTKVGECFDLNARWCVNNRVPKLGDESTPMNEVDAFYDFWYSFKSWRDFSLDLEFDPDQAESRDERRWMERQNAKKAKARIQAEASRIRSLVDLAYKKDPRIIGRREEEKRQKEMVKEQRRMEREKKEAELREEQERKQKEEQEAAEKERLRKEQEKKDREVVKKAQKRARQRVRSLMEAASQNELADERVEIMVRLDTLFASMQTSEEIDAFGDKLQQQVDSGNSRAAVALLEAEQERVREEVKAKEAAEAAVHASTNGHHRESAASSGTPGRPWTKEELSTLSKALAKFPGGTRDRWEKVADFVQTRSAKEVLEMASKMRPAGGHPHTHGPGPVSSSAGKSAVGGATSTASTTTSATTATTTTVAAAGAGAGSGGAPSASSVAAVANAPPNAYGFSKKQQVDLEAAMKKYPASLGPSRWNQISSCVSGKTAKECESRYLELVQYFKQKKAGSG